MCLLTWYWVGLIYIIMSVLVIAYSIHLGNFEYLKITLRIDVLIIFLGVFAYTGIYGGPKSNTWLVPIASTNRHCVIKFHVLNLGFVHFIKKITIIL